MTKSVVIVGAGFNGICSAYMLAKKGYKVTLVDGGPIVGGVMASREVGEYIYDLGCHLFDNAHEESADLIREILDDNVVSHDTVYGCVLEGRIRKGVENPDLALLGDEVSRKIVFELLDLEVDKKSIKPKNLYDCVLMRFGPTAAKLLGKYLAKKSQISLDNLSTSVFNNIVPNRVHCVEHEKAKLLKKISALDDKIAISSMDEPLNFFTGAGKPKHKNNYRQFYPLDRGMLGFCEAATKKIEALGGVVMTSTICEAINRDDNGCSFKLKNWPTERATEIKSDLLFWAGEIGLLSKLLSGSDDLSNYHHKVPMILYYFNVPESSIAEYSYITNYDAGTYTFRVSAPSLFGGGITPKGMGYVCAEVTTIMGSAIWEDSEAQAAKVWQEVIDMGFVDAKTKIQQTHIIKSPVSFLLKTTGFTKSFAAFNDFAKGMANIYYPETAIISKSGIHSDVSNVVERLGE